MTEERRATFAEDLQAVEEALERDLSGDELNMLVTMRDAGKTAEAIAAVLAKETPPANPSTRLYEAVGSTGTVVDITDIPIPTDEELAEAAAAEPAPNRTGLDRGEPVNMGPDGEQGPDAPRPRRQITRPRARSGVVISRDTD